MHQPYLSAAQFVAQREIERSRIESDSRQSEVSRLFWNELYRPIDRRFNTGRKLTGQDFEDMVARIRCVVDRINPIHMEVAEQPATRVSPKGEKAEFLLIFAENASDGRFAQTMFSNRILLTRRMIEVQMDFVGLGVTEHALERCFERETIAWDSRFADVKSAMWEAVGLTVAWRHALSIGLTQNAAVAVPFGDGQILGALCETTVPGYRTGQIFRSGRDSNMRRDVPANSLLAPLIGDTPVPLSYEMRTVISGREMTQAQVRYNELMRGICDEHAADLFQLGRAIAWQGGSLAVVQSAADCREILDQIAAKIAPLANNRVLQPRFTELDLVTGPDNIQAPALS